jgi:hypothetical protein
MKPHFRVISIFHDTLRTCSLAKLLENVYILNRKQRLQMRTESTRQHVGLRGNASDLNSGGTCFEFRPEQRLPQFPQTNLGIMSRIFSLNTISKSLFTNNSTIPSYIIWDTNIVVREIINKSMKINPTSSEQYQFQMLLLTNLCDSRLREFNQLFFLYGSTALVGPRLFSSFLIYSILQSVGLLEWVTSSSQVLYRNSEVPLVIEVL